MKKINHLISALIMAAMTAGFLSYGANVKNLGVIPTPGVAYLTKRYKADARRSGYCNRSRRNSHTEK